MSSVHARGEGREVIDPEPTLIALAILLRTADVALRADQFQTQRLGLLWARARSQQQRGERISLAGLELTDQERQEFGALMLTPALGAMRLDDMRDLARRVVETWLDGEARRSVCEALKERTGRDLVLDLLARCQRLDAGEASDVTSMESVVQAVWGEVSQAWESQALAKPIGVSTGISKLDDALTFRGLARGHVTVLGGATSAGKSALANTVILAAARAGQRALVVALEDDARAVVTRTLAAISRVQNRALQRREVALSERQAFVEACSEAAGFRVDFLERTPSARYLGQSIRSHCSQNAVDLVVVDYLQLIPSGIAARSRQEHIDHIFNELVLTARSLPHTATVVVSQLSRTKGEAPTKESLYHSGALEQWAHTIALLWRPELKEPSKCVALLLEKQKNGTTGMIPLGWDPEHVTFSDPDEYEAARFESLVGKLRGMK
jgi:replicative DNA helicase